MFGGRWYTENLQELLGRQRTDSAWKTVEQAKAYISGALGAMLDLGRGSGPMDHMFALRGEFVE